MKNTLDANSQFGRIIVTKKGIDSTTLEELRKQRDVQIFFANGFAYNQRLSAYSKATSTSEMKVRESRIFRAGGHSEPEQEQTLKERLESLKRDCGQIQEQLQKLREEGKDNASTISYVSF